MQTELILETPPPILSRKEILARLDKYQISTKRWGAKGENSRSLDDLVSYMTQDRLYFHQNGFADLTIDVHAVVVIISHCYRRKWLELYEDRQVSADGSILRRSSFNGIAETMKREGTLRGQAIRCLAEEVGFRDPSAYTLSECLEVQHRGPIDSEKWPGFKAIYHRYLFECEISRRLYRPEGYVELEGKRKIYFKWRPRAQALLKLA